MQTMQINVVVSGGSSDLLADLAKSLQALLKQMIGKMTGKQAALVILGIVALVAGPIAFSSWLEHKRLTQIEELKSKDHLAALEKLSFAHTEQNETMQKIVAVLASQGEGYMVRKITRYVGPETVHGFPTIGEADAWIEEDRATRRPGRKRLPKSN